MPHADVDAAAGAQRLVVLKVPVDVNGAGRHVFEPDVRERSGGSVATSSVIHSASKPVCDTLPRLVKS